MFAIANSHGDIQVVWEWVDIAELLLYAEIGPSRVGVRSGGLGIMVDAAEVSARMRAGVARALRKVGSRRVSGDSLVALLCAAALAPLIAAGTEPAVIMASVGLAGSVGANVLTDVVTKAVDRLRGDDKETSESSVEAELTAQLQQTLNGAGNSALALREAAAHLLQQGAVVTAVVEDLARSDQQLLLTVAEGFAGLGEQFDEFAFAATDTRAALQEVRESLRGLLARTQEDSVRLLHVLEALRAMSITPLAGAPEHAEPRWHGCPYRGLAPFKESDARIFYGRDEMVRQLTFRMSERVDGGGFLVLIGASGSGKTSLLRAGLMPSLADRPGLIMRPGETPLRELAQHLASLAGISSITAYESLSHAPDQAPLLVGQAMRFAASSTGAHATTNDGLVAERRLVIVVDQFEELFTRGAPAAEREDFVAALHAIASAQASEGALILIAVRGDYLEHALMFPSVAASVEQGIFPVTAMTHAQLGQVITGPAAEAGVIAESGLAEAVLADLRSESSDSESGEILPLVSQAMAAAWEHREGDRLTIRSYRRSGGAADAVNRGAQAAYATLTTSQRQAARLIFTRLTRLNVNGRLERQRCRRSELHLAEATGTSAADIDAVIKAFQERQLLVLDDDGVEIIHDVLLGSWKQLNDWLRDDQADRAIYSQVESDARTWDASGREAAYLYQPGRLASIDIAARRWAEAPTRFPPLSRVTSAFLEAGRTARYRAADRRRAVIVCLIALTMAASTTAVIASRNAAATARQRDIALSGELVVESDAEATTNPLQARIDSLAAWRLHPSAESRYAMLSAAALPEIATLASARDVTSVAYSAQGTTLAASNEAGSVGFWNADDYQPVPRPRNLHATISVTGVIQLWNSGTYRQVMNASRREIRKHLEPAASSPDGKIIITADSLDRLQAWAASTGRMIAHIRYTGYPECLSAPSSNASKAPRASNSSDSARGHAGRSVPGISAHHRRSRPIPIATTSPGPPAVDTPPAQCYGFEPLAMSFSPKGGILAVSTRGAVHIWDLTAPRPGPTAIRLRGADELAFSPDGEQLAIGTDSGSIELVNIPRREQIGRTLHTPSAVGALAFSPGGTMLAAGTGNGAIDIWSTATHRLIGNPFQTASSVSSVAFAPDGRTLASADGQAQIWTIPSQARTDLDQNLYYARSMAFSQEGNHLAIELGTGLQILDVISRRLTTISTGAEIVGMALSQDSPFLAITTSDDKVQMIDINTNHRVAIDDRYGVSSPLPVLNSSGTLLATSDVNGMVTLANLRTHQVTNIRTGYVSWASTASFINGGTALALRYEFLDGGPVQVINLKTRGRRTIINNDQIMATNASGTELATVNASSVVQVWNTSSLMPGRSFYGGNVSELAISPDGTVLAVGHPDGEIQLWDASTGRQIGQSFHYAYSLAFLTFASNGRILVAGGSGGNVQTWEIFYLPDVSTSICQDIRRPLAATEKTLTAAGQIDAEYCPA